MKNETQKAHRTGTGSSFEMPLRGTRDDDSLPESSSPPPQSPGNDERDMMGWRALRRVDHMR